MLLAGTRRQVILSGAKVLRKLGVDVGIVAVALEIAVWAAVSHFPHK
jgi:hypothetical protein